MSDHRPITPKPAGAERRREERLEFSRRCTLTVTGPAWAAIVEPYEGRTEDITAHGMRLHLPGVHHELAGAWADAAKLFVELTVRIVLPDIDGFPPLVGQIVWVHCQAETKPMGCSIGVLFSILKTADQTRLQELLKSLQ